MRRGITLLEVLVAGVLLSIGLLGALEVVAGSASTARQVQDRARALMFARSKMDEILKEPVLQTGTDRGQGVDTSTDYDWEALIEPTQNAAVLSISVAAQNRVTGVRVTVTTLRRPDLQTPPATGAGDPDAAAPAASGGPV
jgi:type II secretory pathway pseudopilin PulG